MVQATAFYLAPLFSQDGLSWRSLVAVVDVSERVSLLETLLVPAEGPGFTIFEVSWYSFTFFLIYNGVIYYVF